jgi:tRNA-2-methylthio-N6-dimethylallyladenosine synthase
MSKKVLIETYGCQMNEADTELMYGLLRKEGYQITTQQDEADVVLLNTCAVREKAEERIFGRLGWLKTLKAEKPNVVIGVTGCMAERMRDDLVAKTPFVDLVVGPDAYRRLPSLVSTLTNRGDQSETTKDNDPLIDIRLDRNERYERVETDRIPGVSGWVTIQRGCDKFCSFCIVPFVRGRERSLNPNEVVEQVKEMADQGFREVTLLGQTVSSYYEQGCDFADLLSMVHEVQGIERIRFTSPYPNDFSNRLLERLASLPKMGKFLHLPVQSGNSRVLKDMRRGYTREKYLDLIDRVRHYLPDYALSTDAIVGYPSETEEEFLDTMSLFETVQYDSAFMFFYSEREGTLAARQKPDDVPLEVKKERLQRLIQLQEKISAQKYAAQITKTHEVLVFGSTRRDANQLMGKSSDFKNVVFPQLTGDQKIYPGDLVKVEIKSATSHTLSGVAIEKISASPIGDQLAQIL